MKIEYKCPNCKKEISLQKVTDNFNLCYHCNSDLNTSKELDNFKKSKETVVNKSKQSNSESRELTTRGAPPNRFIKYGGLFILLSGICSLIAILLISNTDFTELYKLSEILRFLGISGVVSLCIGGFFLILHSN